MKKAFTLTELLVVMAIILILAACAIPVAKALREGIRAADTMPTALDAARSVAMSSNAHAGIVIIHDIDATRALLIMEDVAHVYVPADGIALAMAIASGTQEKRINVPIEYEEAVVIYNPRGHCVPGKDILLEHRFRKSTAVLKKGMVDRYLHRYLGGFVR